MSLKTIFFFDVFQTHPFYPRIFYLFIGRMDETGRQATALFSLPPASISGIVIVAGALSTDEEKQGNWPKFFPMLMLVMPIIDFL